MGQDRTKSAVPGAADVAVGGASLTYRLWQAENAISELASHRGVVKNALVESALVNLRSLCGFLLVYSPKPIAPGTHPTPRRTYRVGSWDNDVRPHWFGSPHLPALDVQGALDAFYDAASNQVAHAVVVTTDLPGDWPAAEALLVIANEFDHFPGASHRHLLSMDDGKGGRRTINDVLAEIRALNLQPYSPGSASDPVRDARTLLRTCLGW